LNKSRGWISAFAGSALMFAAGNFQYIFGVFIPPLITTFGWSRAAISWSVTLRNIVSSITMPLAGSLTDKYSAKRFIFAGILIVALSYWLSSRISNLWQLYATLGILTGVGISLVFVPTVTTISKWFGGKSALPNGVVYSGFGLSQMILPPIATLVILRYGWGACFSGFAVLAVLGGMIAWFFIKEPPKNQSEGKQTLPSGPAETVNDVHTDAVEWTLSTASHTRTMWSLVFINVVVAVCFQIIAIHIVVAATDIGIKPQAAAVILTVIGMSNTIGRLVASSLALKFGNRNIMIICLVAEAVLMFFLAGAKTLPVFLIIGGLYGLFYGGETPIMPTITAEYFGTKSFGSIFGVVNMAFTAGAAIGPLAAGYVFDITGRYYLAFMSAGVAMVLAFVLCLTLRMPQLKGKTY
jgi:MFS family permease